MRQRVIVGLTLALAICGLLLLDGWLAGQHNLVSQTLPRGVHLRAWLCNGAISTLIVLVLTWLAVHELVKLARVRGYRPFGRTAQFFSAALVLGPFISYNLSPITGAYDESWGMLWMSLGLAVIFFLQAALHRTDHAMENLAITLFIIFYAGGLAGFLTKLRMEVGGTTGVMLVLFSMFLVKMTDTGAYFTGRAFGRHKMIEWLSPKKTWEGFVGGIVVTLVLALLVGHWLESTGLVRLAERNFPHAAAMALLGLLLGIVSVAGDLAASLLKRDAAVKDSGHSLPGLGGVLDVLDSPLLSAPMAWFFWTRMFHVLPPA